MAKNKKFTKNAINFTVKQYADYRGVTRQTVYKHIRNGRLSKSVVNVDGKTMIDKNRADIELAENLDRIHNPNPEPRRTRSKKKNPTVPEMEQAVRDAGFEKTSLSEAQRLQANYKAALTKLEYEQKSGQLVSKADVETEYFTMARQTRDALLNIPDRISAELASYTDVHVVSQKITEALIECLEDLSK